MLESLTPRRLQLDSHDVLCGRALRVLAQHVHSSLTSWTFPRVQIDRGDGDLQSLWPASSDMSQLICCCCIAVIACGIGLFHMARASSRLTSVHVNIILGTHTLCVSACLPPRRALTYAENAHMCLHTLTCCTHIFLHITRAHFVCVHFAHFSCVSHTRMAQGHEKGVCCMRMSFLSISPSPFSCLMCLPCCSCTVTSGPTSPTHPSARSCRTFPAQKSAGQAHVRTSDEQFGYLAKSVLHTRCVNKFHTIRGPGSGWQRSKQRAGQITCGLGRRCQTQRNAEKNKSGQSKNQSSTMRES